MFNFDDFVKKTEDELKVARESAKTKAETEAQYKSLLTAALKVGWNQLFTEALAFSSDKQVEGKKFFSTGGTTSIMLGEASVSLLEDWSGRGEFQIYKAVYKKTYQDIHSEDAILEPSLDSSKQLLWKAATLETKVPVSTVRLAEALIAKLVSVYKDGQLSSLRT
jgi:hypothetical protein